MTADYLTAYLPNDVQNANTTDAYRDALTRFKRYVTDVKGIRIHKFLFTDCTYDFVLEYRNWLIDTEHLKESTVNHRITVIKAYLKYAAARDIALQQVLLNVLQVPSLRVPKEVRETLTKEQVKAMLSAPKNTRFGRRDMVLMSVMFDTAMRVGELTGITIGDVHIDCDNPYVFVEGKGNKERIAPLSKKCTKLVKDYIEEFHGDSPEKTRALFYTKSHGEYHRMTERNAERIVKKYANQTSASFDDFPDSVYPHMMRRTRSTGWYQDGVSIEQISAMLGHASVQTTLDHYAVMSMEQKREVVETNPVIKTSYDEEAEWDDEDELSILCGLRP